MATHAAISIDDDLATRRASISQRATHDEPPRRVDVDLRAIPVIKRVGQHRFDDLCSESLIDLLAVDLVRVLRRQDDGIDTSRPAVVVFNGDLGLSIGPQPGDFA